MAVASLPRATCRGCLTSRPLHTGPTGQSAPVILQHLRTDLDPRVVVGLVSDRYCSGSDELPADA